MSSAAYHVLAAHDLKMGRQDPYYWPDGFWIYMWCYLYARDGIGPHLIH